MVGPGLTIMFIIPRISSLHVFRVFQLKKDFQGKICHFTLMLSCRYPNQQFESKVFDWYSTVTRGEMNSDKTEGVSCYEL